MSQHDMIIADAVGATVREDINNALQALASTSKDNSNPPTVYAGQHTIRGDTPSATVWTERVYDGTDHIPSSLIDTTNNRYLPAIPIQPGGRLTLTSSTPVMTADSSGATTVYYTPHLNDLVPIYSTFFAPFVFSELSLALDSNSGHTGYHQSGKNFDLFVFNDAGTIRLGTGPAWSSNTSRGTGAGTTELQRVNGVWTNKVSMTARFGSASGNTVTIGANQGTYVGTMRCTADGQTSMTFKPSATGGGNANVLGLWNAYHRVNVLAYSRDNTANWANTSATWAAANGNTNNKVSWIDGLQQSTVEAEYLTLTSTSGAIAAFVGVALDWSSGAPDAIGGFGGVANTNGAQSFCLAKNIYSPQIGFHSMQAVEASSGSTTTFFGVYNSVQAQSLTLKIMM